MRKNKWRSGRTYWHELSHGRDCRSLSLNRRRGPARRHRFSSAASAPTAATNGHTLHSPFPPPNTSPLAAPGPSQPHPNGRCGDPVPGRGGKQVSGGGNPAPSRRNHRPPHRRVRDERRADSGWRREKRRRAAKRQRGFPFPERPQPLPSSGRLVQDVHDNRFSPLLRQHWRSPGEAAAAGRCWAPGAACRCRAAGREGVPLAAAAPGAGPEVGEAGGDDRAGRGRAQKSW